MSLKYSNTTADYLVWSDAMNLIRKLAKDDNYKMSLLVALGCFTGLRISDILAVQWNQILGVSEFTIIEKKTGKQRTLRLNPQLQQHIQECYEHIQPIGVKAPDFGKSERNNLHYPSDKQDIQGYKEEVQGQD